MTLPGWTVDGSIHRHNGYTIEPASEDGPGWVLHATDPAHPVLDSIDDLRFSSLKAAKSAAIHHRLRMIRRTKMIRHVVLATVGIFVVIPAFVLLVPGPSSMRVGWFVVGLAVLLLILREMTGLTMLLVDEGWDYAYDAPRLSWVDRAVADVAVAVVRAPQCDDGGDGPEPQVHVIGVGDAASRR